MTADSSDRAGTRTQDQRINLPQGDRCKIISVKPLRFRGRDVAAKLQPEGIRTDPDFDLITAAWPRLSADARGRVTALVRAELTPIPNP